MDDVIRDNENFTLRLLCNVDESDLFVRLYERWASVIELNFMEESARRNDQKRIQIIKFVFMYRRKNILRLTSLTAPLTQKYSFLRFHKLHCEGKNTNKTSIVSLICTMYRSGRIFYFRSSGMTSVDEKCTSDPLNGLIDVCFDQ